MLFKYNNTLSPKEERGTVLGCYLLADRSEHVSRVLAQTGSFNGNSFSTGFQSVRGTPDFLLTELIQEASDTELFTLQGADIVAANFSVTWRAEAQGELPAWPRLRAGTDALGHGTAGEQSCTEAIASKRAALTDSGHHQSTVLQLHVAKHLFNGYFRSRKRFTQIKHN